MFHAFFNYADIKHAVVEGNVGRYIYTGEHLQVAEYRFSSNERFTPPTS